MKNALKNDHLKAITEKAIKEATGPQLVEYYNAFADILAEKRVKRFATLTVARERTMAIKAQYNRGLKAAKSAEKAFENFGKIPTGPKHKPARPRGTNLKPIGGRPIACLAGSKQSIMLDLLSRPQGASMEELIEALGKHGKPWKEITVRAGFGWDMKLKGYGVKSKIVEDEERFFVVIPNGFEIPPHRERGTPHGHRNGEPSVTYLREGEL